MHFARLMFKAEWVKFKIFTFLVKRYHFAKAEVVNLRQVIELNLYYVVLSGIQPILVLRKFNCKNKKITFSLASTDILDFAS